MMQFLLMDVYHLDNQWLVCLSLSERALAVRCFCLNYCAVLLLGYFKSKSEVITSFPSLKRSSNITARCQND